MDMAHNPAPAAELLQRLKNAYDGEVIGAVMFAELGEGLQDPYEREVYFVHQQVEQATRDIMKPVMIEYGVVMAAEPDHRYPMFKQFFLDRDWDQQWKDLEPQLAVAVERFAAIRDQLDPEAPGLIALVEHEEALLDFSREQNKGNTTTALDAMHRYLAKYGASG
ncbi:hypothetical protein [Pseudonocardia sp. GCM10023141]|uniref:hypothetical protein n=1 Tax=Pseudonocardia sp. GCM10023141 TaxID=3252653 RepID=UPI003622BE18